MSLPPIVRVTKVGGFGSPASWDSCGGSESKAPLSAALVAPEQARCATRARSARLECSSRGHARELRSQPSLESGSNGGFPSPDENESPREAMEYRRVPCRTVIEAAVSAPSSEK